MATIKAIETQSQAKVAAQAKAVEKVNKAVTETIDWVDSNPNAELDEFEAKKKDLEDLWKPIITKAYQAGAAPSGDAGAGAGAPDGFSGGDNKGPEIDEVD